MRFQAPIIAALGFFTAANTAPTAQPEAAVEIGSSPASPLVDRQVYSLTSYTSAGCSGLGRIDVFSKSCSKLGNTAKSIKFQLFTIPTGCIVFGYSDDKCKGFNNMFVQGPTSKSQCYKTLPSASTEAQSTIKSIKLVC